MKIRKNKKGFTIVELVIVIGVIGILSAILIPTFVNVTRNAEAAALKSNLANAYSAYTSEAADSYVDDVYKNTASEGKQAAGIKFLAQEEVCVVLDGKYYKFDGEWKSATESNKGVLVVDESSDSKYYSYNGTAYTEMENTTQQSLSTFNKAVFYTFVK